MSDPFYRTPEWRRLRKACLDRDPYCKAPACGRPSSHADHIIPRRRGGSDTLGNLRGLCTTCHNRHSASGSGKLRAIGCDATGQPLDPGHWWNEKNSSGDGG